MIRPTRQVVGELSLADNQISRLPSDLSGWKGLQKLHLYGNQLDTLPVDSLLSLPSLQQVRASVRMRLVGALGLLGRCTVSDYYIARLTRPHHPISNDADHRQLWLEGNPLSQQTAERLLRRIADGGAPPSLRGLGLDTAQLSGVDPSLLAAAQAARPGVVRSSAVHGSGPGYFKLQKGSSSSGSSGGGSSSGGGEAGGALEQQQQQRVLVVAFGSAPGLPNWGGALRQVQVAMDKEGIGE